MSATLDRIIWGGLLLVVVLTALAHGAVEPWSVLLFELLAVGLMGLWALSALANRQLTVQIPPLIGPLVGFVVLGLAQSVVLTGPEGNAQSLSFDVEATRSAVLVLISLLAYALLAANFLAGTVRLQQLTILASVYGTVLAIFALIQHFAWNEHFFWFRLNTGDSPFGPFVNRNHFAGYMELLLPWPVARLWQRRTSLGEKLLYGFAAAWMGAAVALSLSRGGMISVFAQLMFILILSENAAGKKNVSGEGRSWLKRVVPIAALLVAITTGVLWLGGERLVNRLSTGQETEGAWTKESQSFSASRGSLWRGGWEVFLAHPLTGVGIGAFEIAYPTYSKDDGQGRVVGHAHNDYLQVLTDGGIIGGALAVWFLVVLWRRVGRSLQLPDHESRPVAMACAGSLFGLMVHSLFDFNLQLPSHALLFVMVGAVACVLGAKEKLPSVSEKSRPVLTGLIREQRS